MDADKLATTIEAAKEMANSMTNEEFKAHLKSEVTKAMDLANTYMDMCSGTISFSGMILSFQIALKILKDTHPEEYKDGFDMAERILKSATITPVPKS